MTHQLMLESSGHCLALPENTDVFDLLEEEDTMHLFISLEEAGLEQSAMCQHNSMGWVMDFHGTLDDVFEQ